MARSAPGPVTSAPRTLSVPATGFMNPATIFRNVVFPQPDGPTIATNSPSPMSRSTSLRAVRRVRARTFSYAAVTSRASMIVDAVMAGLLGCWVRGCGGPRPASHARPLQSIAAHRARKPDEAGLDAPASLIHAGNVTTTVAGLQAFALSGDVTGRG